MSWNQSGQTLISAQLTTSDKWSGWNVKERLLHLVKHWWDGTKRGKRWLKGASATATLNTQADTQSRTRTWSERTHTQPCMPVSPQSAYPGNPFPSRSLSGKSMNTEGHLRRQVRVSLRKRHNGIKSKGLNRSSCNSSSSSMWLPGLWSPQNPAPPRDSGQLHPDSHAGRDSPRWINCQNIKLTEKKTNKEKKLMTYVKKKIHGWGLPFVL